MQQHSRPLSAVKTKERIIGFDLARALAIFGMVIINFKVVMGAGQNGPGWLVKIIGLLEGRAAATFVILAGVGMSLLSHRAFLNNDRAKIVINRNMLLKRALFLLVVGLLYTPLWPADILHFYAVYIAVCAFILNSSNRRLWFLTFGFLTMFVILNIFLDYEQGWNWETLAYDDFWTAGGMIRHLFFNGFHPVFPWTAFMLVGLWLGRQDMKNSGVRRRLLLYSAIVVILAEAASRYLIYIFGGPPASTQNELTRFFFGTSPMPPMPLYLLAGGGTAVMVITLCVMLGEKFNRKGWLKPFISTGQLALTNYVAHVVLGMGLLEIFKLLYNRNLVFALASALVFCVFAVLASHLWCKRNSRGPLEWLMRKLTG